jgi:hypothetical protein
VNLFISFFATVLVFGLLVLVLTLRAHRAAKRSITSAGSHGNFCQCHLARQTIQTALAKNRSAK